MTQALQTWLRLLTQTGLSLSQQRQELRLSSPCTAWDKSLWYKLKTSGTQMSPNRDYVLSRADGTWLQVRWLHATSMLDACIAAMGPFNVSMLRPSFIPMTLL